MLECFLEVIVLAFSLAAYSSWHLRSTLSPGSLPTFRPGRSPVTSLTSIALAIIVVFLSIAPAAHLPRDSHGTFVFPIRDLLKKIYHRFVGAFLAGLLQDILLAGRVLEAAQVLLCLYRIWPSLMTFLAVLVLRALMLSGSHRFPLDVTIA